MATTKSMSDLKSIFGPYFLLLILHSFLLKVLSKNAIIIKLLFQQFESKNLTTSKYGSNLYLHPFLARLLQELLFL